MANYPFKINIQTKNGTQLSYYSSSFATSAATNVSASAVVTSINGLQRAQYTQSEAVPNLLTGHYSSSGATGGIAYLSASHDGPQSGSITFTDTEDSDTNSGLDFYTFWGTKVCSVLGLPEGIPIYTENFKFSDNANDTTNYISGDVIADGITVKEGFKLSTQARVRGNLIFDDVFGEGFIQFVSGSVTKMTVGYNDDKDFYKIGGATNVQLSGSSATLGATKTTALTATSLSGITSLNLGSGGTLRTQQILSGQMGENIMRTSGAGSDATIYWNYDFLDQNHRYRAASDGSGGYLGDNTSGTILNIDAGLGRVGINDTSPSYTLDVAGTFGVTGDITVGGTVDGVDVATIGGYLNQAVKTTSTPYFSKITLGKEAASANVGTIYVTSNDGDDGLQFVRDDTATTVNEILGGIGFDSTDGNVPSSILESSAFIAGFASETHTTVDKGGYLRMGVSPVDQNDDTASDQIVHIDQYGMRVGKPGTGDNWISLYAESGDAGSGAGISFYETGTFDTTLGTHQYGAKIVYNETDDLLHIGTIQNSTFTDQLRIPRADTIISTLHVVPRTDNFRDLGQSGLRWDDVFATNGTINTSDRNEKTQISGSDLGLDFVNSLNPVKYQFKFGSRTHYGLVAQEVSQSLTGDFAGYIEGRTYQSGSEIVTGKQWKEHKDQRGYGDWEDWNLHSTGSLGLRYNEFISPMIKAIQELSSQVESLRAQISGSG